MVLQSIASNTNGNELFQRSAKVLTGQTNHFLHWQTVFNIIIFGFDTSSTLLNSNMFNSPLLI